MKGRRGASLLIHRLAIVLAAWVVCVGIAAFWCASPLTAALGRAARESAAAEAGHARSHHRESDPTHAECVAVAFDEDPEGSDDDEDAPRSDVPDDVAFTFPSAAPPLDAGPAPRDELTTKTSLFAAGPALPRGPPACRA